MNKDSRSIKSVVIRTRSEKFRSCVKPEKKETIKKPSIKNKGQEVRIK